MLPFSFIEYKSIEYIKQKYTTMRPINDIFGCNKGSPPNLRADLKASLGEFFGMAIFIFLALAGVQGALEAPTFQSVGAATGPTAT